MRHQVVNVQLLWQAQAALDDEASQPRPRASINHHPLRQGLVWGALTLLALVAAMVSRLT
jgi:hypothetical protein